MLFDRYYSVYHLFVVTTTVSEILPLLYCTWTWLPVTLRRPLSFAIKLNHKPCELLIIPFEISHSHPVDHLQIMWKFSGLFVNMSVCAVAKFQLNISSICGVMAVWILFSSTSTAYNFNSTVGRTMKFAWFIELLYRYARGSKTWNISVNFFNTVSQI